MGTTGFLYSQIGYDAKDPKRALIRSTDPDCIREGSRFEVTEAAAGDVVLQGSVRLWGEKWKSTWWEMDFSELDRAGEYRIAVTYESRLLFESEPIRIDSHLLWDETIRQVAIEQLEERARKAPHGKMGWKDCGANMKEVNSHATTIIGLCDLLGLGFENYLTDEEQSRVVCQLINGCDYLGLCQDKAERLGYPKGAIIHEIPNHILVIPGDVAQSTVAFAYTSRLLSGRNADKSDEYLQRAVHAYEYLLHHARPYGGEGFSHSNHGAPAGFQVPAEWMTRDLLMMLWGGLELFTAGKPEYKRNVLQFARQVMRRQVTRENVEEGLYGHFYTFDSGRFTEKANTHHHVGHDTGSTFPHYIVPFVDMLRRWYDHPDASLWRQTVENFTYGYFIPACAQNPFYLLPEGYFTGQGLLNFCGPWHGINTSIGFAAALAAKLEGFLGERELRKIAVGNIQWIAGLNAGVTAHSFEGCVKWKGKIPEGVCQPISQIHGIGRNYAGCWTGIRGTIPNGYSANPQFRLTVEPTVENDGPWRFTDEDWIPHAAGWMSALSNLREIKFYRDEE